MSSDYKAAGGPRLAQFLDTLPIKDFWVAGHPIVWQTGQQYGPDTGDPAHHTHCSAFVAAAALYLNIYILRPHDHKQTLLSNAQVQWLGGDDSVSATAPSAETSGWSSIGLSGEDGALDQAVAAASAGKIVFAGYQNPDLGSPGHVVLVRPMAPEERPGSDGPAVISVGRVNHQTTTMAHAFSSHSEAWPGNIALFVHDSPLEHDPRA